MVEQLIPGVHHVPHHVIGNVEEEQSGVRRRQGVGLDVMDELRRAMCMNIQLTRERT
jgi:hypothetical protein